MKKIFYSILIALLVIVVVSYLKINTDTYRIAKGNNYFENGEFVKALEQYDKVKSTSLNILINKEKCEIKLGEFNFALDTLNRIQNEYLLNMDNSTKEIVFYDMIYCYYNLNQHNELIELAKEYFKIANNKILSISVENYAINSYLVLQDYNECITQTNFYLKKYKSDEFLNHKIELENILFSCYLATNEFDKALEMSDIILSQDGENLQNYIGRAVLYSKMYDNKYAYDYLVKLRDKFKDNANLENFIRSFKTF